MENKNHPTIEEVIAYFKDAEEVECAFDRSKFNMLNINFYNHSKSSDKSICFYSKVAEEGVYLYDTKNGFAKITKYKPEINLSKITPDLIRELNKDEKIHDILVKEGVIKQRIEFGSWIVDRSAGQWMVYYGENCFYGFDSNGQWFKNDFTHRLQQGQDELATPTEVIERLKAEAERKGIKGGVVVDNSNLGYSANQLINDLKNCYINCEGTFVIDGVFVMKDGIWCDVITEPKTAYIQVPISEIDSLSSKKLGRFVKELRENY